jgi:hypothetical protein
MTPDIDKLKNSLDEIADQVDYLELELVDDPNWAEPSDHSYLSDEERKDPSIMANVEAMNKTNGLISWFARDQEGYVGLWRGPQNQACELAPVVRLDTEGEYELVATTIGDYVAASVDEDDFDDAKAALAGAGFAVRDSVEAIWKSLEGLESPNDYRNKLYNQGRVQRGLEPVEDL